MNKFFLKNKNGFSLIELLVAVAIFGILAAGVFRVVTHSYSNFYGTGDRQTITEFAKEGMEAVRAIRDASWQDIENQPYETSFGISRINGVWTFAESANVQGALTRYINFFPVYRDSNGNIVDEGGTVDPRSRKVRVTVFGSGIADYVLEGYIVNWSSKAWLQTDWSGYGLADFWASTTMASSFTAIATSTAGQATLSAYSFSSSKIITIDSDQVVGSSNHTNFPLYFSATLDSLRTTSNGGDVTNVNGYDIIFAADAAGSTILDHEIESYVSSTGQFEAWVRVPTLDYNDDTNIYMFYGNGDISTSQEDVGGVWDSNFVAVLHMAEDPSISTDGDCGGGDKELCDSTTNNNDADSEGAMTTADLIDGQAGKALDMDGSNDRLVIPDSTSLDGATGASQARTISMWIRIDTGVDNELISDKSNFSGYHFWMQTSGTGGDILGGVTTTGGYLDTANPLGIGTTKYLTMTFDGATSKIFINGVQEDSIAQTGSDDDNNDLWIFGSPSGYAIDGLLDELRVSNVARSEDWIDTEFNNMNSTSTFYYIGTNSGFAYNRSIVIDNTKVSGSQNLSSFPVFVTTTVADLRTLSNGGLVTNDNGYDIVFSSDAAGSTILDYEIEYYSSSTGAIAMWVRVPTLYYSADTTIYLQYGSSTITTSQENITGVWDSNYVAVYHMAEDPSISTDGVCTASGYHDICDNTSNGNHAISGGNMTSNDRIFGPAGYAIDFDGSDDYLVIPDITISQATGVGQARTLSFWLNITTGADNKIITEKSAFDGKHFWLQTQGTSGDIIGGVTTSPDYLDSDPVIGTGTWKYITMTYDGSYSNLYVNGVLNDGPVTSTAPVDDTFSFLVAGAYPNTFLDASFDELRISKIARSIDWTKTESINMATPSTFYTINNYTDNVGAGIVLSAYNTPGNIVSSAYDMGATDQNLNTITIEQNIPSGCSLQVTLKSDDSSDFSSAVSQTFSSSTASLFTSTVTSTMDGYRWLRYEADLTACNSNTQAPTLYSINIDYR